MTLLPRIACLFLLTTTAAMAQADSAHKESGTPVPWTGKIAREPKAFHFVVLPDRTGGEREGVYARVIERANLMQPDFIVSVGDLIEGGTEDIGEIEREWDEFEALIAKLEMPLFYCAGNHDISNETMRDAWLKRFGSSWYHFRHRDVLFLILDSEDRTDWSGGGNMSPEQVDDALAALATHADVRWTCVFMHRPIWHNSPGFEQIEQALADRPYTVFVGHEHAYEHQARHDRDYYVLATAGGISQMRGPLAGEFDHLMWVTMRDDGPRVANLMIEGVWGDDVAAEVRERMLALTDRPARLLGTEVVLIDTPNGGSLPLILKNPTDAPIEIRIMKLDGGAQLADGPSAIQLEAGERRSLDLPIAWNAPAPAILKLTGQITFGPDLRYAVVVPLDTRLHVRQKFTGRHWSFDESREGWDVYSDCEPTVSNGILSMGTTGTLPIIYSDFTQSAPRGRLIVRLRIRSTGSRRGTIYWDTDISGERSAVRSVPFVFEPDGEWHEVTVPIQPDRALSRIAVGTHKVDGGGIQIDWIKLTPAE